MYQEGNVSPSNWRMFLWIWYWYFFFTQNAFYYIRRNNTPLAILKIHNGAKFRYEKKNFQCYTLCWNFLVCRKGFEKIYFYLISIAKILCEENKKKFDICILTRSTKNLKTSKNNSDVVGILDKYELNVKETYTSAGHVF